MSKNKVKGKKMDSNFVSSQIWELSYIAKKFEVLIENVRTAKKEVGKSRHKIYAYIRQNYL